MIHLIFQISFSVMNLLETVVRSFLTYLYHESFLFHFVL